MMESCNKITVFDMVLSLVFPTQIKFVAANCMQTLKQKDRAETSPAHLISDILRSFLDANFSKLFNEFLITKPLAA